MHVTSGADRKAGVALVSVSAYKASLQKPVALRARAKACMETASVQSHQIIIQQKYAQKRQLQKGVWVMEIRQWALQIEGKRAAQKPALTFRPTCWIC